MRGPEQMLVDAGVTNASRSTGPGSYASITHGPSTGLTESVNAKLRLLTPRTYGWGLLHGAEASAVNTAKNETTDESLDQRIHQLVGGLTPASQRLGEVEGSNCLIACRGQNSDDTAATELSGPVPRSCIHCGPDSDTDARTHRHTECDGSTADENAGD